MAFRCSSESHSKGLLEWMRRHPLFSFFFLAYAITWIIFSPYVLAEWDILPKASYNNLFYILHTFGPAIAAYIMFHIMEGKAG